MYQAYHVRGWVESGTPVVLHILAVSAMGCLRDGKRKESVFRKGII